METLTDSTPEALPAPSAEHRSKAMILLDLRRCASSLVALEAKREQLYARRTSLVLEGRSLPRGERLKQRELADAAGVSESAIMQIERKAASRG